MAHSGSWFGLPDFGVTEKLGSIFNIPTTSQGGSNLIGSNPSAQVLGQSTSSYNPVSYLPTSTWSSPARTTAPSGGQQTLANVDNNPYAQLGSAAGSQNDAELAGLNTQYDMYAAKAQNQLGDLAMQRQNTLASLGTQMEGVKSDITKQKTTATQNQEKQLKEAGNVARNTQRANRNSLRALGILDSSAAGELLSKPMNEFETQRADIVQATTTRLADLDNFLNQKTAEHSQLVSQLEQQYLSMVNGIQTDLRFNERQRKDAIDAVNASLSDKLAQIGLAQQSYQNQVNAQKAQLAASLGQVSQWNAPTNNLSAIQSTALPISQTVQTANIAPKKRSTAFQDQFMPSLAAAYNTP